MNIPKLAVHNYIGFGTYRIPKHITAELVEYVIELGCKLIDTAQLYGNEEEVWSVVRNYSNISYTTKIHKKLIKSADKDNRSIETSILGMPTLVLLHSPEKNFTIAWEQLKRLNIPIGVSNFTIDDIKQLSSKPVVNQIEVTPFNSCVETVNYCISNNIQIQAHSSLTKGELLDSYDLVIIAKRFGLLPAQALINWSIFNSYIPIFSSKNTLHIDEIFKTPVIYQVGIPNFNISYKTHPQYLV
jgi:diketogulonate reductase-like aldo/keto reductase